MVKDCYNCEHHTWGDEWWNCKTESHKCKYTDRQGEKVPSNWKPKPMTNADRIRSSDEEVATMLLAVKLGYAPWCDYHCENEGDDGCDNCIKKWLQQPAEGD